MKYMLLVAMISSYSLQASYSLVRKIAPTIVPQKINSRLFSAKKFSDTYDPIATSIMLVTIGLAPYKLGQIIYSRIQEDENPSGEKETTSTYKLDEEDWRIIRIISIANS
jgi:hypothetical protein